VAASLLPRFVPRVRLHVHVCVFFLFLLFAIYIAVFGLIFESNGRIDPFSDGATIIDVPAINSFERQDSRAHAHSLPARISRAVIRGWIDTNALGASFYSIARQKITAECPCGSDSYAKCLIHAPQCSCNVYHIIIYRIIYLR